MADAAQIYTLLECAAGYALFQVSAFDEIGGLLEGSMDTVTDLKRFSRAVKLKAFLPFESAEVALENANAVAEHTATDTLKDFLEMNLPSTKKKGKVAAFSLGVIDPGLGTSLSETVGISCRSDDTIREILRGCKLHLERFVKGLQGGTDDKAQLGLAHSYSRTKIKFNPARSDNMIIQSIALLDQLDKDVNTFAMRVREWYSWHFPELKDIVKDNIMFARTASFVQNKNSLLASSSSEDEQHHEDKLAGLTKIVGDEDTAKAVVNAARTSMGMDCSSIDMLNIINFTQRMVKLAEYRHKLSTYLTDKMNVVAPNLSALIGDIVGARLISKAGSLTNLAKAPASTVQILGAEKALFRALKTKGNTPKYGLIYHSTFIGRAEAKNKGRISRYLANKCSIATRIDSFRDDPSRLYGEKLREQVEERLRFYETGAAPRKNLDVMNEVAKELKAGEIDDDDEDMDIVETPKSKKKKSDDDDGEKTKSSSKKKKKKDKGSSTKKKKKNSNDDEESDEPMKMDEDEVVETPKKSKKEKKQKKEGSSSKKKRKSSDDEEEVEEEKKSDKKKKKKRKST